MVTQSRDITAHTNSQSEMAKVGAASTNRPFTNWRPEMHGKMKLG